MNPTTIRLARLEDRAEVGRLWLRLLSEHAAFEPRFDVAEDALERWTNDFEHWLRDEQFRIVVAEHAGGVVGFITASLWQPAPIYALVEEVYINELYVLPEARGEGIGRRLVEAIREWAAAYPVCRLRIGVLAANAQGRAFWEHLQARPFLLTLTIEIASPASSEDPTPKRAPLGF